jgi:hypothetical protein
MLSYREPGLKSGLTAPAFADDLTPRPDGNGDFSVVTPAIDGSGEQPDRTYNRRALASQAAQIRNSERPQHVT